MRLYQNSCGTWCVGMAGNVRRSLKTKDKAQANQLFRKLKRESLKSNVFIFDRGKDYDPNTLDELKEKYAEMYQNPHILITDIFDNIMKDIGIPVGFSDLKVVLQNKTRKQIPAFIRAEVLSSQEFKCKWCGRSAPEIKLEIDHIVPVSKGGLNDRRNLQALCHDCNTGKLDRTYHYLNIVKVNA